MSCTIKNIHLIPALRIAIKELERQEKEAGYWFDSAMLHVWKENLEMLEKREEIEIGYDYSEIW